MYIIYIRDMRGHSVSLNVSGTESAYTAYDHACEMAWLTNAYVSLLDGKTGKVIAVSD